MIDPQTKVIAQVIQERKNQDRQWGGPTHDDKHIPSAWFDYIKHQINKPLVPNKPRAEDYRSRMIKIAALAVAAVESLDRKNNAT